MYAILIYIFRITSTVCPKSQYTRDAKQKDANFVKDFQRLLKN